MNLSATDKAPSEVQRHSSAPLPMPRAWSANFAKSGQSEAAQMDSGQVQETVQITIPHIAMSELKVDAQSLASGSFKTVYRAYWSNAKRVVALLELRNTRNAPMSAMQEEARIFITLGKHRHLAQLLATSTNPASGDVCMLMEFAPQGNLTHVLNKAEEDQVDVSNQVLITTALQVADAMVHLDLHKVIHRDLAARNVLVFDFDYSNFKKVLVKVTDYGLAMLTHKGFSSGNSIVEVSTHSASLAGPVRWKARESLERHIYSSKSDVWAYGITLWEIMTKACVPYNTITEDREVAKAVLAGERLPRPDNCPEDVYVVMQNCWCNHPKDRPTMPEIHANLQGIFVEASGTSKGESKCIVCLEASAVVAMMPCGHRCVCERRAKQELLESTCYANSQACRPQGRVRQRCFGGQP